MATPLPIPPPEQIGTHLSPDSYALMGSNSIPMLVYTASDI